MKLFGSLRWDGALDFFIGLGGGLRSTALEHPLHSDTVEDLIRISVEGSSLEDFDARESVIAMEDSP